MWNFGRSCEQVRPAVDCGGLRAWSLESLTAWLYQGLPASAAEFLRQNHLNLNSALAYHRSLASSLNFSMDATIEWLGKLPWHSTKVLLLINHSGWTTFRIKANGLVIFLDTWLDRPDGMPKVLAVDDVTEADYIFISHAHFDQ